MTEPIRVAQVVGKMVGGGVEAVVMNYYRHIDRSKVQFDFLVDADSTLVPREEIESLGAGSLRFRPISMLLNTSESFSVSLSKRAGRLSTVTSTRFRSFLFVPRRRLASPCVSPIAILRVVRVSMPRMP